MAPKWAKWRRIGARHVPKTGFLVSGKNGLAFLGGATAVHTKCGMSLFWQFLFGKKTWLSSTTFFQLLIVGVSGLRVVHYSSSSSSLESKVVHESSYVSSVVFCSLAIPCAVANANSLQRANIIADFPFRPANELMTSILRVKSIFRSSSRMTSVAVDAEMGSMYSRSGSITARHEGHVFFVLNEDSKHDMQNLCPHDVMDALTAFISSKHMGHLSASSSFPSGATTFD